MTDKTPRVLYHFRVNDPPGDKSMTLADWITWRQSEDERLERMRQVAHGAFAEGMAAQHERDVNDLTQH